MSSTPNRLAKAIQSIQKVAGPLRKQAFTRALGGAVKFVGTAKLSVDELTPSRTEASLTEEQRAAIASQARGDVPVECRVTDETGIEPIRREMVWAWLPKKRLEPY